MQSEAPSQLAEQVDELHRRQAAMYAGGPVDPVAEMLAENVVWHVPGKSPIAGEHRGKQAVIEYFGTRRRLAGNSMRLHPCELLVDEDLVVQLVDGSAEIGGEAVTWNTVGIYRFESGRVAEAWLVPSDLAKFDRIWSQGDTENVAVVRRFYDELWNRWQLGIVDEIVSDKLRFRGSLGTVCNGCEELKHYVEGVRAAFPDWHNRVDEIIAVDDRVVARMTWSGTHRGPLGDIESTGAAVEYSGAAFFRLSGGLIDEAWVVGDTQELWRALGMLP
jgi:predicted ester cyclase/ketosteroid isomerase-like protein